MKKTTIAITIGDPSGIGAEVTLKALSKDKISKLADFIVIGDLSVIINTIKQTNVRLGKNIAFFDINEIKKKKITKGKPSKLCGKVSMEYVRIAVELAVNKQVDGIVTAPICKEAIKLAGFKWNGHTEYLAYLTKSKNVGMLFYSNLLCVGLVTRHIALRDVSRQLTAKKIFDMINLIDSTYKKSFKIKKPKIAVCGLNPHSSEDGIFGNEEKKIILPAVKRAKTKGVCVEGPFSSDALFYQAYNTKKYDVIIAMYHDQGLCPFKMIARDKGVNVTMGLPFIRTSVDHGTAFDIADKYIADPSSMIEAIKLSVKMV